MNLKKLLLFISLSLILLPGFSQPENYYSISDGGQWFHYTTWTGGSAGTPGYDDHAHIVGPGAVIVHTTNNSHCDNLFVEPDGVLYNNPSTSNLQVNGSVYNEGYIGQQPGTSNGLNLRVYGTSFQQHGYIGSNVDINFYGPGSSALITATQPFNAGIIRNSFDRDITINQNYLELIGTRVSLSNNWFSFPSSGTSTLNVTGFPFSDQEYMVSTKVGADTLIFQTNGYYHIQSTDFHMNYLDIQGNLDVYGVCNFETEVLINDTIQNLDGGASPIVNFYEDVRNKGVIRTSNSYTFTTKVFKNLINEGTWENSKISLEDILDQIIELVDGSTIDGQVQFVVPTGSSSYNWYKDGMQLLGDFRFSGTNSNTLIFEVPVTTEMAGRYYCLSEEGFSRSIYVKTDEPAKLLDLNVLLEGPFSGTEMTTNLNSLLPLSNPYESEPWSYVGPDTITAIPNTNITDWVMVELRDAVNVESATSGTTIAKFTAFLLKNGSVIGLDGISPIDFRGSISQQLYVVIRHRNHIDIMSSNPLTEVGGLYTYNFTSAIDKAYGGAAGYKNLTSGAFGMAGGDADANGTVDATDKAQWKAKSGETGYLQEDQNLDRQTNNMDKNDIWLFNIGQSSQLPMVPPHPCGTPLVDPRDNQSYGTVQIGSQCWMDKNLNLGTMIDGNVDQLDNGVYEKYCYGDNASNCDEYGGLYQWDEMMQFDTTRGSQGICPEGWHIPTDLEWCTLEQYVDPSISCHTIDWRGDNGGGHLKELGELHWNSPNTGATNISGFTAFPGGYLLPSVLFIKLHEHGFFWSSSQNGFNADNSWRRYLAHNTGQITRYFTNKEGALSVRCLQD